MLKIEIWSDFVCPFCYIGTRRLQLALEKFPHRKDVDIQFKSFQLDPEAPLYKGQDYYESLAEKFGSVDRAKQMNEQVGKMAETVGLTFHFESMKPTNTYRAHRLNQLATKHGKNVGMTERIFKAHFTDCDDIADVAILRKLALNVGLPEDEVQEVLDDEKCFTNEVQQDLYEAQQFNITGVPFFIFNRKQAISGAQEVDMFLKALEIVWDSEGE